MLVRHSCRSSSRIALISVPAWPMPIHQTKLMMSRPDDRISSPTPGALNSSQPGDEERVIPGCYAEPLASPRGLGVRTSELIWSVTVEYVDPAR